MTGLAIDKYPMKTQPVYLPPTNTHTYIYTHIHIHVKSKDCRTYPCYSDTPNIADIDLKTEAKHRKPKTEHRKPKNLNSKLERPEV